MAASRSPRKYSWKEGLRVPSRFANVFGETLERIQRRNGWTVKSIVDEARPDDSPTHPMYEWDDAVAGELHRHEQARRYIRHLRVELVGPQGPQEVPMAVSFGPGTDYTSFETAMTNAEMRQTVLRQAMEEAKRWAERYNWLTELEPVFKAIMRVKTKARGRQGGARPGLPGKGRTRRGRRARARLGVKR
ncbi:MAG TPA: hypothetical protein VIV56_16890 [Gemmatimonadales bacterium]